MVAWKKLTVLGGVALLLVAVVSLAIRDASKTAQDRITSLERTKRALEFEKTQLVEQADALQDALTSAKNEASRMQRELSDASLKVRDAEGARLSVEAQLEDLQGKLEAAEGSLKTLKSEVDTSGHKLSESQLAEKQMKLNYAKLSSDLQQCVRDKEEKIAKLNADLDAAANLSNADCERKDAMVDSLTKKLEEAKEENAAEVKRAAKREKELMEIVSKLKGEESEAPKGAAVRVTPAKEVKKGGEVGAKGVPPKEEKAKEGKSVEKGVAGKDKVKGGGEKKAEQGRWRGRPAAEEEGEDETLEGVVE